jgi:hypothetical protein
VAIEWCRTENWHVDEIATRGRLSESVRSQSFLVIGVGALGAPLAELLARGGANRITPVDADLLAVGNLVRHTLTLRDVGRPKAEAVAHRLTGCAPEAQYKGIVGVFPAAVAPDSIREHGVIIDCTGSDDTLVELASLRDGASRLFVSASVGMGARRLFVFAASGESYPLDAFSEAIKTRLLREQDEHASQELPREGTGCWQPVFPARADDVWLMAAGACKQIEALVTTPPVEPRMIVLEQVHQDGVFAGLRRAA